jgi:cytochrome c5
MIAILSPRFELVLLPVIIETACFLTTKKEDHSLHKSIPLYLSIAVLSLLVLIVSHSFAQSSVDAAGIYKKSCASCHKLDGKGGPMNSPDFTAKDWQAKHKDEELIQIITNGQKMMPAFKQRLKAEEIKALVGDVIRKFAK